MKHVKINEAIVQAIKSLDIPVDKVDTEKLLSVFLDLMSLAEEEMISSSEVTSTQDNDTKSSDSMSTMREKKEIGLRTRFDKVNTICKGLEGDYRPYMDRFLFDLHSLLIESIYDTGIIKLTKSNCNDEYVYYRHYEIYQGEEGFIDVEFNEHRKIETMAICYQDFYVKVNLAIGITYFKVKLKSSEKTYDKFGDINEDTEAVEIKNQQFARELADMVKVAL